MLGIGLLGIGLVASLRRHARLELRRSPIMPQAGVMLFQD